MGRQFIARPRLKSQVSGSEAMPKESVAIRDLKPKNEGHFAVRIQAALIVVMVADAVAGRLRADREPLLPLQPAAES